MPLLGVVGKKKRYIILKKDKPTLVFLKTMAAIHFKNPRMVGVPGCAGIKRKAGMCVK